MSQRSPLVSQPDLFLEARFPSLLALIKISENSQLQWLGKEEELSILLFPCRYYLHDSLLLIVCFQTLFLTVTRKGKTYLCKGKLERVLPIS